MGTSLTQQTNILNAAVKKPVERAPKPDGAAAPGAVEGQNSVSGRALVAMCGTGGPQPCAVPQLCPHCLWAAKR